MFPIFSTKKEKLKQDLDSHPPINLILPPILLDQPSNLVHYMTRQYSPASSWHVPEFILPFLPMVIMEQTLLSLITVEQTANAKLLHRTIARVWYAGQFDPLWSWSQSIPHVLWCVWLDGLPSKRQSIGAWPSSAPSCASPSFKMNISQVQLTSPSVFAFMQRIPGRFYSNDIAKHRWWHVIHVLWVLHWFTSKEANKGFV